MAWLRKSGVCVLIPLGIPYSGIPKRGSPLGRKGLGGRFFFITIAIGRCCGVCVLYVCEVHGSLRDLGDMVDFNASLKSSKYFHPHRLVNSHVRGWKAKVHAGILLRKSKGSHHENQGIDRLICVFISANAAVLASACAAC